MRVIVWGINYVPELTGIAPFNAGLCDYLFERGHTVEMVTTFPYYPFWKKIPGDLGALYRKDEMDGVWVHRCWHYVPARSSTLKRIWHELSFGITSFVRVFTLSRADIYIIISPPLILGPLASVISWLKRRPYVFHVQDLQPDAAVGLGMVKVGRFTRVLYKIEAWAYRRAAMISGISTGMIEAFHRKQVPADKCMLFPNWLRSYGRNEVLLENEAERRKRGRKFRNKYAIAEDVFLAAYSGNLGRKQGLETLIDAAASLFDRGEENIVLLVVGDGVMKEELDRKIRTLRLTNIRMMPLLIEADYHGMLSACDVSLILQAPGTGQYFFPSKLLSVLAARCPVISVADPDSEVAKAVATGEFGINILPARPRDLANALFDLAIKPSELNRLRNNTRWVDQFQGSVVLRQYEIRLSQIVEATTGGATY